MSNIASLMGRETETPITGGPRQELLDAIKQQTDIDPREAEATVSQIEALADQAKAANPENRIAQALAQPEKANETKPEAVIRDRLVAKAEDQASKSDIKFDSQAIKHAGELFSKEVLHSGTDGNSRSTFRQSLINALNQIAKNPANLADDPDVSNAALELLAALASVADTTGERATESLSQLVFGSPWADDASDATTTAKQNETAPQLKTAANQRFLEVAKHQPGNALRALLNDSYHGANNAVLKALVMTGIRNDEVATLRAIDRSLHQFSGRFVDAKETTRQILEAMISAIEESKSDSAHAKATLNELKLVKEEAFGIPQTKAVENTNDLAALLSGGLTAKEAVIPPSVESN